MSMNLTNLGAKWLIVFFFPEVLPFTTYFCLFTDADNPGPNSTVDDFTEPSSPGYERVPVTFGPGDHLIAEGGVSNMTFSPFQVRMTPAPEGETVLGYFLIGTRGQDVVGWEFFDTPLVYTSPATSYEFDLGASLAADPNLVPPDLP